jgi:hypothetical protein
MAVRRLALVAVACATAAALSGCNASSLTKQELVVHFVDNATVAERAAALHACAHATPEATPEPFVTTGPVSNQVSDVRFRTDHADDRAIAILEGCLAKQPGVEGFEVPDLTD